MNKIIYVVVFTLLSCPVLQAQTEEKVKGDRNPTINQTYIDPFSRIIVDDDFTVEVIYNSVPSVEIETDSNLHEFITINVNNGVLSFKKTKIISSSKRMNIKVNYTDILEHIEVKDNAEIRSLTSLELENATLSTSGSSRAYLNISCDKFSYTASDKAKVKLNIKSEDATILLNDNVKMEALLNSKVAKIDLYQRASAKIEGTLDALQLRVDNSSGFNGKELLTKTCSLTADLSSSATIRVDDSIDIKGTGNSSVYLYNTPKITLSTFNGNAKLQMKDR